MFAIVKVVTKDKFEPGSSPQMHFLVIMTEVEKRTKVEPGKLTHGAWKYAVFKNIFDIRSSIL